MWALIDGGVVLETTSIDPEGRFHPDLKWRACGAQVLSGWLYVDGVFTAPALSLKAVEEAERLWRDGELSSRQWLRERHRDEQDLGRPTTLSNERFAELLAYLQALRDWPLAEAFPDRELRPHAPGWIDTYAL